MDAVWYYAVNGTQIGPITLADLRAAFAAGKFAAHDLVWKEGMPDWVPARAVADLRPTAAPPPPVRPAAEEPLALEAEPLDAPPAARPKKPKRRREADDPVKPEGRWAEWRALARLFARRAFAPDPAQVPPTPDEERDLTRAGVTDPVARRLAVWRRGVLFAAAVPGAAAALFGLISTVAGGTDGLSGFGILVMYVQALALFALPAFAVLGALRYDRLAQSVRLVLIGALVSLGVPLAVAFAPGHWLLDTGPAGDPEERELVRSMTGVVLGVAFYIVLMPAVLSLLPGVSRACVRLKLLLPESLVPGWGLVASAPLCVLLTLATFVLLYHLVGNVLLFVGLLLWVGAPLYYLTQPDLLVKPVTTPADREALARASFAVFLLTVGGMVLLLVFLFTATFAGKTLLGFDSEKCVLRPWSLDLHKVWIEYVARALFLTVFFADLVLKVALSVWKESKAFAGTPPAALHDATMAGLSGSVAAK